MLSFKLYHIVTIIYNGKSLDVITDNVIIQFITVIEYTVIHYGKVINVLSNNSIIQLMTIINFGKAT